MWAMIPIFLIFSMGYSLMVDSRLPRKMSEGLVGFSHTVHVVSLLHSTTGVVECVNNFFSQFLFHGLSFGCLSRFDDPSHRQCDTTIRTDFDRYLVVCTTNTS